MSGGDVRACPREPGARRPAIVVRNRSAGRGALAVGDEHVVLEIKRSRFRRRSDIWEARMTVAGNLGFPRIGRRRELKRALEKFGSGELDAAGWCARAKSLRSRHWKCQISQGIGHVPSGDFSLYDHVLDTSCMLGAIPPGYGWSGGAVSLPAYFALARGFRDTCAGRGIERAPGIAPNQPALEMTKWFDTNYHYLVPRLA